MKFKFCPKCGNYLKKRLLKEEKVPRLLCSHCSSIFYQNPKPTATAIILKNTKFLMGKRNIEPYKGFWDFPGGFCEKGEHPLKTLKREVKEELNLEIKNIELFCIYMDFYETTGDHTLNLYYLAKIKSGQIRAGSDISEFKWFDIKRPSKKIAFKSQRRVIKDLQKFYSYAL